MFDVLAVGAHHAAHVKSLTGGLLVLVGLVLFVAILCIAAVKAADNGTSEGGR